MSIKVIVLSLSIVNFVYYDFAYAMNQGQGNEDDSLPPIQTIKPTHQTQEPEKRSHPKKTSPATSPEEQLAILNNYLHAVESFSKGMEESEAAIKKFSDEMNINKKPWESASNKIFHALDRDPELIPMLNEGNRAIEEVEISLKENINKVNSQKAELEKMKLFLTKKIQRLEDKMKNSEE